MEFKGLDDWVDIFAAGPQVDGEGKIHDGDHLMSQAIINFQRDTAPVVIGHPATDSPAYGWVQQLRRFARDGKDYLQAKLSGLLPEFVQLVQDGRYKNRSAAFYPDGRLRHVGFLGGAAPAVVGLKPIAFAAGDFLTFGADDVDMAMARRLAGLPITPEERLEFNSDLTPEDRRTIRALAGLPREE